MTPKQRALALAEKLEVSIEECGARYPCLEAVAPAHQHFKLTGARCDVNEYYPEDGDKAVDVWKRFITLFEGGLEPCAPDCIDCIDE